ncbi:hypothetical protein KOR34_31670 [Posidoniimonas corsicana]|uniref:PEP-CTERM protein-sorting domain-containing protein n=1 Tax=Posidoniimonas corsicana TaxID=1938618 RepID=A0A5C5VI15_9BACT|nr:hypothetical protein [Posidoniimonas corsicana]TWT38198.1 hypothetical protein KOR34_31670 [Posidoniimonas corsicana]
MNVQLRAFVVGLSAIVICMTSFASVGQGAVEFTLNFDSTSVSSNTPATGASASVGFEFVFVDANTTLLNLFITNTTGTLTPFGSGATTSMLTGFGFDIVSAYSYVDGSFAGGTYLDTLIENADAQPFSTLDLAAADNSNYNGGNANAAMPEGGSDTVSFSFTGGDATSMAADFKAAFFDPLDSEYLLQAATRFQQVDGDANYDGAGSDKLEFRPPPVVPGGGQGDVPEPVSVIVWAGLSGVVGLATIRRR